MKSTRDKILRNLLAHPNSTINDLADSVGINGISVRHHLTALEAEGLIKSAEERHGVGRPRLIYSLTEKGVEKFPSSYLRLTQHILESLDDTFSPEDLHAFFEKIGSEIVKPYQNDLDGKSIDERLQIIETALTREGFIVEVIRNEDTYTLTNLSCPYHRISLNYPMICTIDRTVINKLIGSDIEIITCIADGSDRCSYKIPQQRQ
jgi:DeoR family transcriptional regulator, suf operon transcriptional repressor